MQKPSMQSLQEESEIEFRKQFDPNSESFHNGLKQPVPLGGDRVPDSMYSMYPEGYDPNKPAEIIDYGEDYKKIEAERQVYQTLKKSLAKIAPISQAFLRHQMIFKEKGDPTNQKHLKVHEQNIQKQQINLKAVQKQLQQYLPTLQSFGEEGKAMEKQLISIIQQSNKRFMDKQSLGTFNFKVKKLSTQVFACAQKCLQQLKSIKKAAVQKKKKQQAKVAPQTAQQKSENEKSQKVEQAAESKTVQKKQNDPSI